MKSSKIVTGHCGFIGSHLYNKKQHYGIDLKEGKNLLTCFPPKARIVYHLAAQASVEDSWKDPMYDSINYAMMTRLVHMFPDSRIIYTASAASKDSSPYGFSKWAAEEYLRTFHTNYVICRLPNVYGPGSRSVVDIFKDKDTVEIYGDGEQLRDYVHVDDIVEGLLLAEEWPVGTYELGSGIGTSVNKLAEGKKKVYLPARKEARESVLRNTTPNWKPTIFL